MDTTLLHFIHLEDDLDDAECIEDCLRNQWADCKIIRVQTEAEFTHALQQKDTELILSDYSLPTFNGLAALSIARRTCPEIPFIFVTGTLGEEMAIETMKNGATDYVLKNRLSRLIPAITRALREQEELCKHKSLELTISKLMLAIQQSPLSIIMTGVDGAIEFVNSGMTKVTGYTAGELIGRNMRLLKSGLAKPEFYRELWETITAGKVWEGEFCNKHKNGALYYEKAVIAPVKDSSGEIINYVGVKENITESRRIKEELLQNEKMALLGVLAAGIAHEINSPMAFISSNVVTLLKYSDRLLEYIPLLEGRVANDGQVLESRASLRIDTILTDMPEALKDAREGIERVKSIIRNLKSFSYADTKELQLADLHEIIESAINISWSELKVKVTLTRDFSRIEPVLCHPQQLNQVFINLLVNAAQSIDKNGEITIHTWTDSDAVFVSVRDTGCGIPPENRKHIFEAFFTTKAVGKGTGLGLSISNEIIKKHGGDISVESKVGAGSTFTVKLPLNQANPVQ